MHNSVTIVGGGIVGLVAAILLAKKFTKVAIIETRPPRLDYDENTIDLRCSAITPGSLNILRTCGVAAEVLAAKNTGNFSTMKVWDDSPDAAGKIKFNANDLGVDDLGYIIENRVLRCALWEKAKSQTNIKIFNELPAHIEYDLLVAADGANSSIRQKLNIPVQIWEQKQTAIVATVKTAAEHQHTAWQRFKPDGPLAFLPLADKNTCSIVWTTTPQRALILQNLTKDKFNLELSNEFAALGRIELIGERASFNLRMLHAKKYVVDNTVLIGDAAHVVHPLAGQGLNLGLYDAAALLEATTLGKYERWRKSHNIMMLATMSLFKQLFSNDNAALKLVRNLGLNMVDSQSELKNAIMQRAMGLQGDLPEMTRIGLDV